MTKLSRQLRYGKRVPGKPIKRLAAAKRVTNVVDDLASRETSLGLLPGGEDEVGTPVTTGGEKGDHEQTKGDLARASLPETQAPFVSPSVSVRLCFDTESQTLVPPPGWHKDAKFRAPWPVFVAEGGPEDDDIDSINRDNLARGSFKEWGWQVRAVRNVKLWVVCGQVRELVRINWRPAWVPLAHVHIPTTGLPGLEEAKKNPPHFLQIKDIWRSVVSFMAQHQIPDEGKYYARKVFEYADIRVKGKVVPSVRVEFAESWEHAGALTHNKSLWEQVCKARLSESQKIGIEHKKIFDDFAKATREFMDKYWPSQ